MNQKIEDVGKKLDLAPADLSVASKGTNRVYWGIHAMAVLLSGVVGLISGYVARIVAYPYEAQTAYTPIIGLNLINGFLTLPNYKFSSDVSRLKRVGIFCGNIVLSLGVYLFFVSFDKIFPNTLGISLRYGVYTDAG
jgi:uncharacterized membrane protein